VPFKKTFLIKKEKNMEPIENELPQIIELFSGAPLLSKFGNLSSQEILVVTQYEVAYTGYNPVLNPVFMARNRMVTRVVAKQLRQQKSKTNL